MSSLVCNPPTRKSDRPTSGRYKAVRWLLLGPVEGSVPVMSRHLVILLNISSSLPFSHCQPNRAGVEDQTASIPGLLEKNERTLNSLEETVLGMEASFQQTFSEEISLLGDKITTQLARSLRPLENLNDLHKLEVMADKMGDPVELKETLHDGLRSISDRLNYRTKIDSTLHSGLEKISQKVDAITSLGLSNVVEQLSKLKPFHSTSPGDLLDDRGYLPSLSTELRSIVEHIRDQGDNISSHLITNKEVDNLKKLQDQQNDQRIIDKEGELISSLDSGHEKVVHALTEGQEKVATSIDKGREAVPGTLFGGQIMNRLQHNKAGPAN